MYRFDSFSRQSQKSIGVRKGQYKKGVFVGLVAAILAAGAMTTGAYPTSAVADQGDPSEYRLDALDKFRLKVVEWRPALDEVFEWKALNDDYTVGPTGYVSIPLIGDVRAGGKSASELSKVIGKALKERIGLVEMPMISVEVKQYRPFYITGQVEKPGEFAYRPRLTVLQAVSIAGGLARDSSGHKGRDLIAADGEVRLSSMRRLALLAERARLKADLDNAAMIDFPADLDPKDATSTAMMRQENDVLTLQRQDLQDKLGTLSAHKDNLSKEMDLLERQIKVQESEKELAQAELDQVEALSNKQLTTAQRRLTAQRNVFQLEADRLRQEGARQRLLQSLYEANAAIDEMQNGRRSKLIVDIRRSQMELDEVTQKLVTAQMIQVDAEQTSGAALLLASRKGQIDARYVIVRNDGGRMQQFDAMETSVVEPGDTIKVEIESSASNLLTAGALRTTTGGQLLPVSGTSESFSPSMVPPVNFPAPTQMRKPDVDEQPLMQKSDATGKPFGGLLAPASAQQSFAGDAGVNATARP